MDDTRFTFRSSNNRPIRPLSDLSQATVAHDEHKNGEEKPSALVKFVSDVVQGAIVDNVKGAWDLLGDVPRYVAGVDSQLGEGRHLTDRQQVSRIWTTFDATEINPLSVNNPVLGPLWRAADVANHMIYGSADLLLAHTPNTVFNDLMGLDVPYFTPAPTDDARGMARDLGMVAIMAATPGIKTKAEARLGMKPKPEPVSESAGFKEYLEADKKLRQAEKNAEKIEAEPAVDPKPSTISRFKSKLVEAVKVAGARINRSLRQENDVAQIEEPKPVSFTTLEDVAGAEKSWFPVYLAIRAARFGNAEIANFLRTMTVDLDAMFKNGIRWDQLYITLKVLAEDWNNLSARKILERFVREGNYEVRQILQMIDKNRKTMATSRPFATESWIEARLKKLGDRGTSSAEIRKIKAELRDADISPILQDVLILTDGRPYDLLAELAWNGNTQAMDAFKFLYKGKPATAKRIAALAKRGMPEAKEILHEFARFVGLIPAAFDELAQMARTSREAAREVRRLAEAEGGHYGTSEKLAVAAQTNPYAALELCSIIKKSQDLVSASATSDRFELYTIQQAATGALKAAENLDVKTLIDIAKKVPGAANSKLGPAAVQAAAAEAALARLATHGNADAVAYFIDVKPEAAVCGPKIPNFTPEFDPAWALAEAHENGMVLAQLPPDMQENPEIVEAAVRNNWRAFEYAGPGLKANPLFTLEMVEINSNVAGFIDEKLKNDPDWALEAVKRKPLALKHLRRHQGDPEIVREAVTIAEKAYKKSYYNGDAGEVYKYAAPYLKSYGPFALDMVEISDHAAQYVDPILKEDFDWALEAVRRNSYALGYLSAKMQNNDKIVEEAVKKGWHAFVFASDNLKTQIRRFARIYHGTLDYASEESLNSPQLAMEFLDDIVHGKMNPGAFRHLSESVRNNSELMLEAIRRFPRLAEFAGPEFRPKVKYWLLFYAKNNIHEIQAFLPPLLDAYKYEEKLLFEELAHIDPDTFKYATDSFRSDPEFVLKLIEIDPRIFKHASDKLKKDPEFTIKVVTNFPDAIEFVDDSLKDDPKWAKKAVEASYYVFRGLKESIKKNKDVFLAAAGRVAFANSDDRPPDFKSDRKFALDLVEVNPELASKYVDKKLLNDPKWAMKAVKKNSAFFGYLPEKTTRRNFEIAHAAVSDNGENLSRCIPEHKDNPAIVLAAINENGAAIQHASERLRNKRTFAAIAVKQNGEALVHLSLEYRSQEGFVLDAIQTCPEASLNADPKLIFDPAFALRMVRVNGLVLEHLPHFQADPEIVTAAFRQNNESLAFANASLRADPVFMAKLTAIDGKAMCHATASFEDNPALAVRGLESNPDSFDCVDKNLLGRNEVAIAALPDNPSEYIGNNVTEDTKYSPDIIYAVLSSFGGYLENTPKELNYKNDLDAVLTAVKSWPPSITQASEELRLSPLVIATALEHENFPPTEHFFIPGGGDLYGLYTPPAYYGHSEEADVSEPLLSGLVDHPAYKNLAVHAVSQGGIVLKFLPPELQDDPVVVEAAVRANGLALKYASPRLQKDFKIVRIAVGQNGDALEYAHSSLQENETIVRIALSNDPGAILYSKLSDQENRKLISYFFKKYPKAMRIYGLSPDSTLDDIMTKMNYRFNWKKFDVEYASLKSKETAKDVLNKDGMLLSNVPAELKYDGETVLAAAQQNGLALQYASRDRRADPKIQAAAFKQNFNSIKYMIDVDPGVRREYERIRDELAELGITQLDRFPSTKFAMEVIANRKKNDGSDKRPVVGIMMSPSDWNGGLANSRYQHFADHFRIMYYEVKDKKDIMAGIDNATRYKKAAGFIISGHGERSEINLKTYNNARTRVLHFDDDAVAEHMSERLECNGFIYLSACSTGQGKSSSHSLANTMRKYAPQAHIYSVTKPWDTDQVLDPEITPPDVYARYLAAGIAYPIYDGAIRSGLYAIEPSVCGDKDPDGKVDPTDPTSSP